MQKLHLYFNKKLSYQFIKFCIIGLYNTLLDFFVYIFLTRNFHFFSEFFIFANIISFCIAATNSFILNRNWTFNSHTEEVKKEYGKFLLVSIIGVILNTAILYSLVVFADYNDIIAKIFAVASVLFWNFAMNKKWTFKK